MTSADFRTLRLERVDAVLRVTIDHPRSALNAVDEDLHRDLVALFAGLRRESEARAVVLTGRGRAFSAGGDFAWFPTLREPGRLEALRRDAKQLVWDLLDVELPIVAAVNGHAMGLGASIALLCDVIFMADTATIGDPHVRVGIVAGDGGVAIWPLAVGPARAKEYLLTGDPLSAQEAERIGLVNRVVPAAELDAQAMAFAARLAAGAPLAVRYTKLAVNKLVKDALNVAFDASTALELVTFQSEDHRGARGDHREAAAGVQGPLGPARSRRHDRETRLREPCVARRLLTIPEEVRDLGQAGRSAPFELGPRVAPDGGDECREAVSPAVEHERRVRQDGAHGRRVPEAEEERVPRLRPADRGAPFPLVAQHAVAQRRARRSEREARDAGPDRVRDRVVVASGEERRRPRRTVALDAEDEHAGVTPPALDDRAGDGSSAILEQEEAALAARMAQHVGGDVDEELAEPAARVRLVERPAEVGPVARRGRRPADEREPAGPTDLLVPAAAAGLAPDDRVERGPRVEPHRHGRRHHRALAGEPRDRP
jgi:enoyl-CoA hydratase